VGDLLLSPHNDDETLFAAYVCLRHRPKVIVALDGATDRRHLAEPATRVAESAAAMELLGCEFRHLGFPVDLADWSLVRSALEDEQPDHVWAPLPELGGHRHHNRVAELAIHLWPGRVSFYSTYHVDEDGWPHRSVVGDPVEIEPEWENLKRAALACYPSQSERPGTAMHFERPLDEYVVPGLRLNLGGGINPIPGYLNLDRVHGWRFEDGLFDYPDGSVEVVTESHSMMYVDGRHWPFVCSEVARVLEPGGVARFTQDAIGAEGSSRPVIRPRAKVATSSAFLLRHLERAGLEARVVEPDETAFVDRSAIQQNYGSPPDVFHVEAVKA
jgi:LmbE family N-acetylglucosaminyl deacetylase